MKRCPECRRDYYDGTLLYCLDDGSALLDGPASADEEATAILSGLAGDAPTKELTERFGGLSKRNSIVAAAVGFVLLLTGAGYWFYGGRDAKEISSIAVLPFENGSGNADLDYLSDGVSESVIDRLSQLPQLKVIPRSSSFRYRDRNPDLKAIANALGVQAVVTGRFVPRGDGYDIRVELIDVLENKQLWGDSFTRKAVDLQLLQTDISRMVAENLRIRLTGAETGLLAKQRTTNPQAYDLLLKGRFWFNKAGTVNFTKAAESYEQAVTVDPAYALAYAELSQTYNTLGAGTASSPVSLSERRRLVQKGGDAARKALDLDENLAEAHYALAVYKFNTWEWQEADRAFRRTFDLSPNMVATVQMFSGYAGFLSLMKRHDEAIAEVRRVIEISPVSLVYTGSSAVVYLYARRYDEALTASNRRLELDKALPVPFGRHGEIYEAMGRYEEAVAAYQEAMRLQGGDPLSRESFFLGALQAKMGDRSRADDILKKLEDNRERVLPTYLARLYEARGQRDAAITELEKAFAERLAPLPLISVDPAFDSMRSDPRFQDLVRRMGLPQ